MEIITCLNDKNSNDILRTMLQGMDYTVLSAEDAGIRASIGAAVSFSQKGSVDLTLMLPDGAKIHFKAAGNELSQVNNVQAENPGMVGNSSVENAMAQIKQFLAENPEIGQLSAKKQKNIYDREKKRKKLKESK